MRFSFSAVSCGILVAKTVQALRPGRHFVQFRAEFTTLKQRLGVAGMQQHTSRVLPSYKASFHLRDAMKGVGGFRGRCASKRGFFRIRAAPFRATLFATVAIVGFHVFGQVV